MNRRISHSSKERHLLLAIAGVGFLLTGFLLGGDGAYIWGKAKLGQQFLHTSWHETLATGGPVKPWSWADMAPTAFLNIPRLGMAQIVLDQASGQALAWGPGHQQGTAMPGDAGLAIIAGHRDTHFSSLDQLRPGDAILITRSDGKVVEFVVEGSRVADAVEHGLDFENPVPRLALVTCWPLGALVPGGPERLIVMARLNSR